MFWELIATLITGIAAAGAVMLVRLPLKGFIPGWVTPVTAGLAMLAFTIYSEYNWYPRTLAALPDGIEITAERENTAWFRPWTYARPFIDGFVAVDTASVQTNPALPDARLVTLYIFGRGAPTGKIPAVFNCAKAQRADVIDSTTLPTDSDWRDVPADDPTLLAACAADS